MNIGNMIDDAFKTQREETLKRGNETARNMKCPSCSNTMKFITEGDKYFYVCVNFPSKCDVSHGAYPDGRPFGKPADAVTRKLRALCHRKMDELFHAYRGPLGPKTIQSYLYTYITDKMGVSELHFGLMNDQACKKALGLFEATNIESIVAYVKAKKEQPTRDDKLMAIRGLSKKKVEDSETRKKRLALQGIYIQ